MKKIKTLKKNYEFKNVLSNGKYYIKKQIIIYITDNKKQENYIGIAISSKLCNSVTRNKIKRLIRENYIKIKKDLKKGNNIVFLWNKKINPKDANFFIIGNDIKEAFKEANILKE